MQEQPSTKPTIAIENTPHDGGVIVAWKDGLISSTIGNKKKSFEEKARERSISVGMDHGMALLGKLHENESNSRSCVLERTSELPSPSKILPPTMMEGRPPLDPQPRAWSRSISTTSDHIGRHHDKRTFVASPGEASIGTLGSRLCDTCTDEVSPGKASDDPSGGSHDDAPISHRQAKRIKATANDHPKVWPEKMMTIIKSIVESFSPRPDKPLFEFAMTSEAAEKNFLILKSFNFDMKKVLEAQANTPMGYGSEFRKGDILQPLLQNHPLWPRLTNLLKLGSQWPTTPISEEDRVADLLEALSFGNHKGASSQPKLLEELVTNDVVHGYALPLPLDKITRIPGICMAPLNIQPQWTINERGEIVEKDRLTHDQSFKWTQSGTSVNSRIDTDLLQQCKFGKCLTRIINWTVAARRKFPNRRIMAKKDDIKSAYRRMHLSWDTATQTVTQIPDLRLALMMLRLSFGGAPGPFEFSVASEMLCDLINAIKHNDEWDPYKLHGKNQHLVPPPELLDDSIPFAEGLELIVDIYVDPRGITDVYIDDFVSLSVDMEGTDNLVRCDRAPLLGLNTMSRPLDPEEPIPRETMEALKKLEAEALLQEIKTVLGWEIDFRRLLIKLPENKFIAWTTAIKTMLDEGSSTAKNLETKIGRLVHLSTAIPFIHHFMSRLRDLHTKAVKRRSVKINGECYKDLEMMLEFLKMANDGIRMNSITFRKPTHVYRSDSCPHGLGGYSHEGWAWRWYLPENLLFRASNNLLEHLASFISPWVDILAGRLNREDCVLSMTDSTTAEGWLRKSNFTELGEDPIQASVRIKAARKQATLFMSLGLKSYSQWFEGKRNQVSDALSRDNDRSDEDLTLIIKSSCPTQVPSHFEIQQLPSEIISWLTALLLKLPVKEQLREVHTKSKLGHGAAGKNTCNPSDSKTTTTSRTSHESNGTPSLEHLPWLSGKRGFRENLIDDWLRTQSEVPSSIYRRPLENMGTQIQPSTRTAYLHGFYNESLGHSKTKTLQKTTKQPSQSQSSQKSTNDAVPSSNEQPPNLPHSPSSLPCDHASTSKSTNPNNDGQKSSDSAMSASSGDLKNSAMTTQN